MPLCSNKKQTDMKQSHYRALLTLGLPIVIGQIGVIVLGFADTLMVGHHSSTELAAASFVNNMFNLAIIFSTGFAYGLTPVVGRLFGEGKTDKTGEVLKNSIPACPYRVRHYACPLPEPAPFRSARRADTLHASVFYRVASVPPLCALV